MKTFLSRAARAAVLALLALAFAGPAFGQAEKIKQKAKDLKKQVEGGPQQTNKPPVPPVPPVPPKPVK